jgi:hypothetical protein
MFTQDSIIIVPLLREDVEFGVQNAEFRIQKVSSATIEMKIPTA